jgi:hypothetical protein
MEDIKVGEYVRTKKGKIFKYGKGRAYLGKDNYITKHSFNLIDLLEVRRLCKWRTNRFYYK